MSENEKVGFWKREEVRGLFVLGVITTIQGASKGISDSSFIFGEIIIPMELFTFLLTAYWGFYALMMVFAVSSDIFSESISLLFEKLSKLLLKFGIYALSILFSILFIIGNLSKIYYIFIPIIPTFIYIIIFKIIPLVKSRYDNDKIELNIKNTVFFLTVLFLILFIITYIISFTNMFSVNNVKIFPPIEESKLMILTLSFNVAFTLLLILNRKFNNTHKEIQKNE